MNDEQAIPDEEPVSYIMIQFAETGSTLMNVINHGVFPGQLIVAGDYLMREGHRVMDMIRQQQEAQAKENQIVKPSAKIIVPK